MSSPAEPRTAVDHVMVPAVTGCLLDNYAQDVLEVLEQLDHDYMPVVDSFVDRRPVGVVARADLRRLVAADADGGRVVAVLMAGVPVIALGTPVGEVAARVGHMPVALVVDDTGALAGYLNLTVVLTLRFPPRPDGRRKGVE